MSSAERGGAVHTEGSELRELRNRIWMRVALLLLAAVLGTIGYFARNEVRAIRRIWKAQEKLASPNYRARQDALAPIAWTRSRIAGRFLSEVAFTDPDRWVRETAMELAVTCCPDSTVARGCREYVLNTRGGAYSPSDTDPVLDYVQQSGIGGYSPREIPLWPAWLEKYPNHPGADDAAYRLGRAFEEAGRYAEALEWFEKGKGFPDGDMVAESANRERLIFDLRMSADQIAEFARTHPSWPTAWDSEYQRGLQLFRTGEFAEAAPVLRAAVDSLGKRASAPGPFPGQEWQTYQRTGRIWTEKEFEALGDEYVRLRLHQADLAEVLAVLTPRLDRNAIDTLPGPVLYRIARLFSRFPRLFENAAWRGQRFWYFQYYDGSWSDQPLQPQHAQTMDEAWLTRWRPIGDDEFFDTEDAETIWIARSSSIWQAFLLLGRLQQRLPEFEPDRVAYARVLCFCEGSARYCELNYMRGCGDWDYIRNEFVKVADRFSKSRLADDALYEAARFSAEHDEAVKILDRIVDQYPGGDRAGMAREYKARRLKAKADGEWGSVSIDGDGKKPPSGDDDGFSEALNRALEEVRKTMEGVSPEAAPEPGAKKK